MNLGNKLCGADVAIQSFGCASAVAKGAFMTHVSMFRICQHFTSVMQLLSILIHQHRSGAQMESLTAGRPIADSPTRSLGGWGWLVTSLSGSNGEEHDASTSNITSCTWAISRAITYALYWTTYITEHVPTWLQCVWRTVEVAVRQWIQYAAHHWALEIDSQSFWRPVTSGDHVIAHSTTAPITAWKVGFPGANGTYRLFMCMAIRTTSFCHQA